MLIFFCIINIFLPAIRGYAICIPQWERYRSFFLVPLINNKKLVNVSRGENYTRFLFFHRRATLATEKKRMTSSKPGVSSDAVENESVRDSVL